MTESHKTEFLKLVAALQNGSIDSDGVARVEELALKSPELRQFFLEHIRMTSDLRVDGNASFIEDTLELVLAGRVSGKPLAINPPAYPAPTAAHIARSVPRRFYLLRQPAAWGATFLLVVAVFLINQYWPFVAEAPFVHDMAELPGENSSTAASRVNPILGEFVARMTSCVDCVWKEDAYAPPHGAFFRSQQRLKLQEGHVEIEFFNGAILVAKGPAELEIRSSDTAVLHAGMVRVRADFEAIGFTVLTPQVAVVDMGTEFGVSVDDTGAASVDVFEGHVLAQVVDNAGVVLENVPIKEGTAIQFDASNHAKQDHPMQGFNQINVIDAPEAYQRWQSYRESLAQDPTMVAHYTFDHTSANSDVLKNHSMRGDTLNGQIVEAKWCDGRWPEKGALNFDGDGSRVLIDVPGDSDQLSMAAWICPDSSGHVPASLLHSDGHTWDHPGSVHWMIHPRDRLHCAFVDANKRVINSFSSATIASQGTSGWHHVAVVCDMQVGTVTQYIDGRTAGLQRITRPRTLRIGSGQIGNSSISEPDNGRRYTGRIDEFVVFRRALTAVEIQYMYTMGRPR